MKTLTFPFHYLIDSQVTPSNILTHATTSRADHPQIPITTEVPLRTTPIPPIRPLKTPGPGQVHRPVHQQPRCRDRDEDLWQEESRITPITYRVVDYLQVPNLPMVQTTITNCYETHPNAIYPSYNEQPRMMDPCSAEMSVRMSPVLVNHEEDPQCALHGAPMIAFTPPPTPPCQPLVIPPHCNLHRPITTRQIEQPKPCQVAVSWQAMSYC